MLRSFNQKMEIALTARISAVVAYQQRAEAPEDEGHWQDDQHDNLRTVTLHEAH